MGGRSAAGGLRAWACGCYADEAAVELLARAFGGRFASEGAPWVRPSGRPGTYWLDPDTIDTFSAGLSGGERRVLAVVAALAGDKPLEDLAGILAGVDRPHLALILAALAHASGSHQQADLIFTAEGGQASFIDLPALVSWPTTDPTGPAGRVRRAA